MISKNQKSKKQRNDQQDHKYQGELPCSLVENLLDTIEIFGYPAPLGQIDATFATTNTCAWHRGPLVLFIFLLFDICKLFFHLLFCLLFRFFFLFFLILKAFLPFTLLFFRFLLASSCAKCANVESTISPWPLSHTGMHTRTEVGNRTCPNHRKCSFTFCKASGASLAKNRFFAHMWINLIIVIFFSKTMPKDSCLISLFSLSVLNVLGQIWTAPLFRHLHGNVARTSNESELPFDLQF